MAFSTASSVRDALAPGGEADSNTTAASLDNVQLEDAIAEADATIKAHLHTRYDLTEPVANPIVKFWSRNIAAYLATLTFRKSNDLPEDDPVRLRYEATMSALSDAADGSLKLEIPAVTTNEDDVTVVNRYEGVLFAPQDFGLTKYEGWFDPNSPYYPWAY